MTLLVLSVLLLSPSASFGQSSFLSKPGPLSLPLEIFPYKHLQHLYFYSTPAFKPPITEKSYNLTSLLLHNKHWRKSSEFSGDFFVLKMSSSLAKMGKKNYTVLQSSAQPPPPPPPQLASGP